MFRDIQNVNVISKEMGLCSPAFKKKIVLTGTNKNMLKKVCLAVMQ